MSKPEIHDTHFAYIREGKFNTVAHFLMLLDALELNQRRRIIADVVFLLHWHRRDKFENTEEDYESFKTALSEFNSHPIGSLLILGIVHSTLSTLLRMGDVSEIENVKSRLVAFAEHMMADTEKPPGATSLNWLVDHIERVPEAAAQSNEDYITFCEKVVEGLLDE